jgi:hypothetical protein
MSEPKFIVSRRTVDHPYERVASRLREAPGDLLQRATATASGRAASVAASLRVSIIAFDVAVNVRLLACAVREISSSSSGAPELKLELAWTSCHTPELFPPMLAELSTSRLDSGFTRLEFRGSYWPPLGPVGAALDAAVGHRVAAASIEHLLDDLVAQLHRDLSVG